MIRIEEPGFRKAMNDFCLQLVDLVYNTDEFTTEDILVIIENLDATLRVKLIIASKISYLTHMLMLGRAADVSKEDATVELMRWPESEED